MKAGDAIKLMRESLGEAALPHAEFQAALDALDGKKVSGNKEYYFKLANITKNEEQFNYLCEKVYELQGEQGSRDRHAPNGVYCEAIINVPDGGADEPSEEDISALWDATVTAKDGRIIVEGWGTPSGGGGSASLAFNPDGSLNKVVRDNLKGIIIDEDECELLSVYLECSPELYNVVKQVFGPSAPAPR